MSLVAGNFIKTILFNIDSPISQTWSIGQFYLLIHTVYPLNLAGFSPENSYSWVSSPRFGIPNGSWTPRDPQRPWTNEKYGRLHASYILIWCSQKCRYTLLQCTFLFSHTLRNSPKSISIPHFFLRLKLSLQTYPRDRAQSMLLCISAPSWTHFFPSDCTSWFRLQLRH